jgi:hypothetical protein
MVSAPASFTLELRPDISGWMGVVDIRYESGNQEKNHGILASAQAGTSSLFV